MTAILVIDDEQVILNMLQEALSRSGYKVEAAGGGREGIDTYDQGCFDLIITDVCMPDVDGLEVLRHIRRSRDKSTPIIGISGTPWVLEGSGFDSILPKPFSLKVLFETIDKLTGDYLGLAANA